VRRFGVWASGAPAFAWSAVRKAQDAVGGHNGWVDIYGLVGMSKVRFFSEDMKRQLTDVVPLAEIGLEPERMKRWHPLNRELCVSGRGHLPGLLLNAKGDRVAMNSSVECRYPFLDEEVFEFLAKVHPRYKFRGLREKYLLRRVAEKWLPSSIAWRRKAMFRAPFDSFHLDTAPPFVDQLLSTESLTKTGYFNVAEVQRWRTGFRSLSTWSLKRVSIEMGLVGVLATQLWHHTYIEGGLCELSSLAGDRPRRAAALVGAR
jgi:asparagine synthase (glutamine-hydrolysing)